MQQGVDAENSDSDDENYADNADCSDYKYSPVNFLGLNICVLGSLIYTKVNFPYFFPKLLLFYATSIINPFFVFHKNSSQVTFTGKRQSVAPKAPKVEKVQETV